MQKDKAQLTNRELMATETLDRFHHRRFVKPLHLRQVKQFEQSILSLQRKGMVETNGVGYRLTPLGRETTRSLLAK